MSPYYLLAPLLYLLIKGARLKTNPIIFDDPTEKGSYKKMDKAFLRAWDVAVKDLGFIPYVTSGIRSVFHNMTVGGVPNSLHIVGRAADIRLYDNETNNRIIHAFVNAGFQVIYEGDHIHIELDY